MKIAHRYRLTNELDIPAPPKQLPNAGRAFPYLSKCDFKCDVISGSTHFYSHQIIQHSSFRSDMLSDYPNLYKQFKIVEKS